MQTWAVANQKGGVGKTTTAVNLAAALALRQQRVLLLDFDPQASASAWLGMVRSDRGILDALHGRVPLSTLVMDTGRAGLSLIASTPLLGLTDHLPRLRRDERLREAVAGLPASWDWCLIDCPPNLGDLLIMALTAAPRVLVPVETRVMALAGLAALFDVAHDLKATIGALLPCRADLRTRLSEEVIDALRKEHGRLVLRSVVRESVRLAEAPGHGKTIFEYAPTSAGAEDYAAVALELSQREG